MAGALHAPAKKNYLVYQTLMRDAKIENFAVAPAGLDCGRPLKELLSTLQNRETRREIHFASSKPAGHTAYHPFRLDGEDSGFTTPCEDCCDAFAHFSRKDVMLLTGAPTKSPFDFVGLFALGDGGKAHLLLADCKNTHRVSVFFRDAADMHAKRRRMVGAMQKWLNKCGLKLNGEDVEIVQSTLCVIGPELIRDGECHVVRGVLLRLEEALAAVETAEQRFCARDKHTLVERTPEIILWQHCNAFWGEDLLTRRIIDLLRRAPWCLVGILVGVLPSQQGPCGSIEGAGWFPQYKGSPVTNLLLYIFLRSVFHAASGGFCHGAPCATAGASRLRRDVELIIASCCRVSGAPGGRLGCA